MRYAIGLNGDKIEAKPEARATCTCCGKDVVAKCGEINVWHWAHRPGEACDEWAEPDTEWLLYWKSRFPSEWVEQVVERKGVRRFADVVHPNGSILKLQQQSLAPDQIREREAYYGTSNLIWLFDTRDAMGRFEFEGEIGKVKFRWKHARKRIAMPRAYVYLDLGRKVLMLNKMHVDRPFYGTGRLYTRKYFIDWFSEGAERSRRALDHVWRPPSSFGTS